MRTSHHDPAIIDVFYKKQLLRRSVYKYGRDIENVSRGPQSSQSRICLAWLLSAQYVFCVLFSIGKVCLDHFLVEFPFKDNEDSAVD